MTSALGAAAFAAHALTVGCCTNSKAESAVNVTVKDTSNKAFVCDAEVLLEDGEWSESVPVSLFPDGSCTYNGAVERAGEYSVRVSRRGFFPKTFGISVESTVCSVEPRSETAELERDPQAPAQDFLPLDGGGADGG
jgi:hypothetical protein